MYLGLIELVHMTEHVLGSYVSIVKKLYVLLFKKLHDEISIQHSCLKLEWFI